jgi:hypothetical protein
MKRCPLCDKVWEDEKLFCPWDGHRLKAAPGSENFKPGERPPIESQFEVFSQLAVDEKTLEDSLSRSGSGFNVTDTSSLVDVALSALQKKRAYDQELVRDQMKLMEQFNLRCRTMQYFVDNLQAKTDSFRFKVEHKDETQKMWLRFTLSFGESSYQRTFPVTITYHREPTREVTLEIDLYEIGPDKDSRYLRTEKAGGKPETTIFGHSYKLMAPKQLEGLELVRWLETSFKSIFRLAYSVD